VCTDEIKGLINSFDVDRPNVYWDKWTKCLLG